MDDILKSAASDSPLRESIDKLGDVDLRSVPGEAWIDGDGRVRRFEYEIKIPQGTVTTVMQLSRFGETVRVVAPPAFDVSPYPDAMEALEKEADARS
jgi:hypothetical protein